MLAFSQVCHDGYRKLKQFNKTHVVIEENEAQLVRKIFFLYVHENESLWGVARIITETGIKPRRGGARWDISTIRDIVKNPTYLGTSYFGKTEVCESKSDTIRKHGKTLFIKAKNARRKRPEEEWIPLSVPQIISESDFELAQERLKKNKALSSRNTVIPGLLQGLIICGICGQPYYKRTERDATKIRGYYYCRANAQKSYKKCPNKSIRQEVIDAHVFEEVLQLLQTPSLIQHELVRRANESSNLKEVEQQEIILKKELAKLSHECDRLLDAYQKGVIELDELKKRNTNLESQRRSFEKEMKGWQAQRLNMNANFEVHALFNATLENIKTKGNCLTFDEKRKLVRLLVEQVIITEDSIRVIHCISPHVISKETCLLKADGEK